MDSPSEAKDRLRHRSSHYIWKRIWTVLAVSHQGAPRQGL